MILAPRGVRFLENHPTSRDYASRPLSRSSRERGFQEGQDTFVCTCVSDYGLPLRAFLTSFGDSRAYPDMIVPYHDPINPIPRLGNFSTGNEGVSRRSSVIFWRVDFQ